MTLHAEVTGSGPTLVLLHGFTGSIGTWEPALALLAARHRVVTIDLPGLADAAARATRASADDVRAQRLEREGLEPFVDAWMAQPLFATQRRLAPDLLTRQRAARREHDPVRLAAALRALGVGRQAPLWDRLPTLRVPTLVVAGEDDHQYRTIADAMTARLSDARVAVIPDAGHAVHLENPVPFWSVVEAFLALPIAEREGVSP